MLWTWTQGSTGGSIGGMGDNESEDKTEPPESSSERTLRLVLAELKEIKSEMSSLRKIEEATANFSKELSGISSRTADLEEAFEATSARVRELGDDIFTLKTVARKHEQSIGALQKTKEEISNSTNQKIEGLNKMIEAHRDQVDTLQSTMDQFKQEVSGDVEVKLGKKLEEKMEEKFEHLAHAFHFQSLREQAFNNRLNLVILGLAEDDQKSTTDVFRSFLESTLKIKKVEFASAFRMGPSPAEQQSYIRPILVRFRNFYHRNKVWRKRHVLKEENSDQKTKITADLPKELREGVQVLYRVANAASKFEQYRSASIFNYQLELGDKIYQPSQLEDLPWEIRPSTLATPRSENALVFFTRRSFLSNHYPSEFVIEGQKYYTVEQYLAVKRATFSNHPEMLRKAKTARDLRQAKFVLNTLKEDRPDQWYEGIEEILMEALRAKFSQNLSLRSFLIDTNQLLLGEASKDPRWGIGMTLDEPDVLNSALWITGGNLLGRCLMKLRGELPWEAAVSADST